MSNVLIIVEHTEGTPKKASLAGITFGQQLVAKNGGELHLAVIGHNITGVAEAVKCYGATKIHVVDNECFENYLAESYTTAALATAEASGAKFIAAGTTSTSKDFLPRVAARWGASMASDVLEVIDANKFKRPMWAGNVVATIELTSDNKVATARATEFDAPTTGGDSEICAVECSVDLESLKTKFVSFKAIKSERPDATAADVVVSGGRGLKEAQNYKLIEDLADKLGGGVGATRAICDAGWVPNDLQIGQTGKVVAPNLYFAIGISGAIQHLAGMKGSKTIVAINKDEEAPIFSVSDYGLVADLFEAVPELLGKL